MRLILIAFCAGIFWLQVQPRLPPVQWIALLPVLSLAWLLPRVPQGVALLRAIGLASFAFILGASWAGWRADSRLAERLPDAWQGVDIVLVGVVSDVPHVHARGERVQLDVESVLTPGAPKLARIQVTRYWPRQGTRLPSLRAGERWQLTVRLQRPHGTHNPHGFDLAGWMLERRISATGYVREKPEARRLSAQAATPSAWIAAARQAVRDRIFATLGESPHAGVIAALTIGDQKSIPHDQWRAFTRTGVNHLLSISGLHVTMIAALAGGLVLFSWRRIPAAARRLPARQAAIVAALIAALAYALLAGFKIPAQRTLFMLVVLALAFWGRREPRPFSALLWAMTGVLLLDPWAVVSAGFWLSFGAMATILWVGFGRLELPQKLTGWVTVQLAVTLALAPVLLLLFQQVSLVSPLANAVAIPVVSWAVTPLALAGVIAPPLWHAAAWIMGGLGMLLQWMSLLPWATLVRPVPDGFAVVAALVGAVWLLMPRGFPLKPLAVLLWLPMAFPPIARVPSGDFWVDVIDVGQGTAILIRTAKHALLYDTGAPFADSDAGERIIVPYLRASGVSRLHGVIVSHDDSDHTGGLRSILRDVRTDWVMHGLPEASLLLMTAPQPRRCVRGMKWEWDGIAFEILNPRAHAWAEARRRDNDFSCVLRVSRGTQHFLVTGDAERQGELELLESGLPLSADVLIAGHHGSRTSSMPEFVESVSPRWVVYTMGYRNRFGHPHAEVMSRFRERGAVQLRSDRDGRVQFRFGEAGVEASQYRAVPRRYWQTAPVHE